MILTKDGVQMTLYYANVDVFVGREKEILLAKNLLDAKNESRILEIWGDGGLGKSKLLSTVGQTWKKAGVRVIEVLDFFDVSNQQQLIR